MWVCGVICLENEKQKDGLCLDPVNESFDKLSREVMPSSGTDYGRCVFCWVACVTLLQCVFENTEFFTGFSIHVLWRFLFILILYQLLVAM